MPSDGADVDLILENAAVYTPTGLVTASVGIRDGKIVVIAGGAQGGNAKRVDLKDKLILPGVIDCHVHVREPGQTQKEDFFTVSQAAAYGGVTCIMCMPNTIPRVESIKIFDEVVEMGESKSLIDFCLQAAINYDRLNDMQELQERGAVSFEIIDEELSKTQLLSIMKAVENTGIPLGMAACDFQLFKELSQQKNGFPESRDGGHLDHWPPLVETMGIAKASVLSSETGTKVHLRQVSSGQGIMLAGALKKWNKTLTLEVGPHHLFLTHACLKDLGPYGVVLPPLRDFDDQSALWKAITEGTVDAVASDHAPHSPWEKEERKGDFHRVPPGIAGIEVMLPLMLNAVNEKKISLSTLVSVMSENPARIFGLYPKKGAIQVGSDADLVVVAMERIWSLDGKTRYSKAGRIPYAGMTGKGVPVLTLSRGRVVMHDRCASEDPGGGRFVTP